jgi:ribosome-binding protein aMBF1 (putative translation factor)
MVKTWMTPADNEGFREVTYRNPNAPQKREKNKNQLSWEAYRYDPMARYAHDKALHCAVMGRRISKDPRTSFLSQARRDALAQSSWNADAMPMILRKEGSGPSKELARSHAQVNRQKGKTSGELRKVERDAEEGAVRTKTFDREFVDLVRTARAQRELTQSDLAKLVNVLEGDIRDLEKGTLLYDGELKSLLMWKLSLA